QRESLSRGRPQRHARCRIVVGAPRDEAGYALAQVTGTGELLGVGSPAGAEDGAITGTQRRLVCGTQEVPGVDLGTLRIDDRRLHCPLQELVGMAAKELIERVFAG